MRTARGAAPWTLVVGAPLVTRLLSAWVALFISVLAIAKVVEGGGDDYLEFPMLLTLPICLLFLVAATRLWRVRVACRPGQLVVRNLWSSKTFGRDDQFVLEVGEWSWWEPPTSGFHNAVNLPGDQLVLRQASRDVPLHATFRFRRTDENRAALEDLKRRLVQIFESGSPP